MLVASSHTCCKCEEIGKRVQIHHIDENPSNNDPDNLAVLCLACHDETQITGVFARRLSPNDVRLYRDNWLARVAKRRRDADEIFVARATKGAIPISPFESPRGLAHTQPSASDIERYIDDLPNILAQAYDNAREGWDSGVTPQMKEATYAVIEVVRQMWLRLAVAFPERQFGGQTPEEYIGEYIKQRYEWHYALAPGGTISGVMAAGGVLNDLELVVLETVDALKGLGQSERGRQIWRGYWEAAKGRA